MEEHKPRTNQPTFLNHRVVRFVMRQFGSTGYGAKAHEQHTCAALASHIEVSHYELFERAYSWYHGSDYSDIDEDFKDYLLSGCDDIPYYVRQFAREWRPGELAA